MPMMVAEEEEEEVVVVVVGSIDGSQEDCVIYWFLGKFSDEK